MISASILIPTLNPGAQIEQVLEAVFEQKATFPFEVLVVDSGSGDADVRRMRRFPIRLECIAPAEFGHGKTRNLLAREAQGQALVFLTQDAQPATPDWLQTLVDAISEPRVAGAYSRQIPRDNADPFISFFLKQMYGNAKTQVTGSGWGTQDSGLPPGKILFSNVGSAIRREAWGQVPFRDVIMSEDQYWAWDALHAGYQLAYEPAAQVLHSHNYSLPALFRRNWASGASLRGLLAGSPAQAAAHGARHLAGEATYLLRSEAATRLPQMLAYEAVRSAGFWLGVRFGRA